jgi:hypothetical protein
VRPAFVDGEGKLALDPVLIAVAVAGLRSANGRPDAVGGRNDERAAAELLLVRRKIC